MAFDINCKIHPEKVEEGSAEAPSYKTALIIDQPVRESPFVKISVKRIQERMDEQAYKNGSE